MFFRCSSFIYYPDDKIYYTPPEDGLEYKELYLRTDDNARINAWWVTSPANRGSVLFCHGNGGNISTLRHTIKMANELGLNILVFDYRGYGKSDGTPSEKGLYSDADCCMKHMMDTLKIHNEKIIIWGRSLGGAVAIYEASKSSPGAIILESSFTKIKDVAAERTGSSFIASVFGNQYDTSSRIASLSSSVLVIHSKDDTMIPYNHAEKNFEKIKTAKEFLTISGDHNEGFITDYNKIKEAIDLFLKNNFDEKQHSP